MSNIPTPDRKVTKAQRAKLTALAGNKSAQIRYLHAEGFRQCNIARTVGVRDQFVSNIVNKPAPKGAQAQAKAEVAAKELTDTKRELAKLRKEFEALLKAAKAH